MQIVRDNGDVLATPLLVGVTRDAANYVQINGKVIEMIATRGGVLSESSESVEGRQRQRDRETRTSTEKP